MSLRLVFLAIVGVLASGQTTNTGDSSFNGVRCCDPKLGSCTPGLPLCSDVMSAMMTPSPSSTAFIREISASATPKSGCCDPTTMQCTSTMNLCPSGTMTPSASAKFPGGSGACCDPAVMNCSASSLICPSASMTIAPSPRPSQTQTATGKPSSQPIYNCCDPTRMNCTSGQLICPSASMTAKPSNLPPSDCCDPSRIQCAAGQLVCPSASMTGKPSNPPVSGCCDPTRMQCSADQMICPSTVPSSPPAGCCDPTRMLCDSRQPICEVSATPTMIPSLPPIPSDACCDPLKFPCPDFVPLCPPGGGTGLPSIPPNACCDPRFVTCPSFAPICKPSESMTPMPSIPTNRDGECCDPTLFDCPSDAPLCKPTPSMTPKSTQRGFSASASFSAKPTMRPIPSTLTQCCDPLKYKCLLGMPICRPSVSPQSSIRSDTTRPVASPTIPDDGCCDPMIARCASTAVICPSQRPLFSAKPSPIYARPTQYVIFQVPDAVVPAGSSRPTPSAAPSRWPIRNPVNLTALGLPRPEAIVSRVGFGGANVTELMKPSKLQELLVQLGCTFRMPLENIRITNITVFDVQADKLRVVAFDPMLVNLRSDGQIVCMPAKNGSRQLRGRVLQTSGSSSENVNVEYAILDPSDDILSLDDAEFSSVLASSSLNDFQASIGGGASAILAPGGASSSPAASASGDSLVSDDARVRIGLGVGLGITGFAALAAIGTLVFKRRNPARRRPTSSVHVMYTTYPNPANPFTSGGTGVSDRRVFNPLGSRV